MVLPAVNGTGATPLTLTAGHARTMRLRIANTLSGKE